MITLTLTHLALTKRIAVPSEGSIESAGGENAEIWGRGSCRFIKNYPTNNA